MSYALLIDTAIAALLIATIAYAIVLSRKLSALRQSKPELEGLLQRFAESTGKVESGIAALIKEARESGEALHPRAAEGRALADDLAFLIEKGDAVADRLQGYIDTSRGGPHSPPTRATAVGPAKAALAGTPGRVPSLAADQELLKALEAIR